MGVRVRGERPEELHVRWRHGCSKVAHEGDERGNLLCGARYLRCVGFGAHHEDVADLVVTRATTFAPVKWEESVERMGRGNLMVERIGDDDSPEVVAIHQYARSVVSLPPGASEPAI